MYKPYRPEQGMRVVYGRSGFNRTGWKGTVIRAGSINFKVEWDDVNSGEPTTYSMQAWAKTQFKDRFRDRDKHYIFFDEEHPKNKLEFFKMFDCGVINTNPCCEIMLSREYTPCTLTPPTENEVKKTLVKQTLVNGVNIKEVNEEQLIRLICELEGDVRRLGVIEAESKHIKKMVGELNKAIKEVVTELDSRS